MINKYTDYEFYAITYKGNMPEDDFDRLVIRASYEIRDRIFNRDTTGFEDEVQMATCSVADVLNEIEQIEERKANLISSNKIIASEQVADLSRTYANVSNIKDLDDQISNLKNKKEEEIRKYLLETGLMYRGV